MADTHNLRLPDGTTIQIPGWATETTLRALSGNTTANNRLINQLINKISGLTVSSDEIEDVLREIVEEQDRVATAVEKSRPAEKLAKAARNTISNFSETDKPLTKMVDLMGDLGGGLSGAIDAGKANIVSETLKDAITKYLPAVEKIGAGAMMWLGWNAAKLEQFADAQSKMIDSGAIFYDTANAFDELYSRALDAGITYTQFSDITQKYGGALQALGTDVSSGADEFLSMFYNLNEAEGNISDQLGDFGLTSKDMANLYAEYINTSRLSGNLKRGTVDAMVGLEQGFTDLMVETTALANLTSENRSDILARQMAAISDPNIAGALKVAREKGLTNQADVAEAAIKQLALLEPKVGKSATLLADAISTEFRNTAHNLQNFDVNKVIDPSLRAALEKLSPGFVDRLNAGIKSGEIDNVGNFIIKEFASFDKTRDYAMVAGSDPIIQMIDELQKASIITEQDFGKLANMNAKQLQDEHEKVKTNLSESGKMTKAINTLTTSFLQVQDALTMPLQTASAFVENFSLVVEAGAKKFSELVDDLTASQEPIKPAGPRTVPRPQVDENGNPLNAPKPRELKRTPLKPQEEEPAEPVVPDNQPLKPQEEEPAEPVRPTDQRGPKPRPLSRRATGGPITAKNPSLVGENGPEIFVPSESGTVIPTHKTMASIATPANPSLDQLKQRTTDMYEQDQKRRIKEEEEEALKIALQEKQRAIELTRALYQTFDEQGRNQRHQQMVNASNAS